MTVSFSSKAFAFLLPFFLLVPMASGSQSAERKEGDWCSSVIVRPDRRWQSIEPCVRAWTELDVAKRAGVVTLGTFRDVFATEDRFKSPLCGGPFTHETNAAYLSSIRELRPSNMASILFVQATRFDLVSPSHVEAEGFRSSFLLKTKTPISKVESFFESDHSAACGGGCRWAFRGSTGPEQVGMGIDRAIDAKGPGPAHDNVVYYVSLRDVSKKSFSPLAAVADLTNSAYREWRVKRAKNALKEGGYDAVMLNHKFPQYYGHLEYWLGSSSCSTVSGCNGKPDTIFSAPPDGYGFAEYVAGWVALAHDLQSAGVPYVVRLIPHPWLTRADDPATSEVNEASQIRSVLNGARLVMLDAGNTGPDLSITEWAEQLRLSGVRVLIVDKRCGYAKAG